MDKRSFIFVIGLTLALFFVNQWFAPSQSVATKPPVTKIAEVAAPDNAVNPAPEIPPASKEEYFVLENAYQQIVFSNKGGAIAEINLPLASKENKESIVLSTALDRAFQERYQINDYFPAFSYYINDGSGVKKKDARALGGYSPLLRRTLFDAKNNSFWRSPTRYYALRVVSEDQEGDGKLFSLKRLEKDLIEFELSDSNRKITKTFSFPKDPEAAPYCLEVKIKIDGDSRGLWLSSGVPEVELISDNAVPALTYRITKSNQKSSVESLSLPKECSTTTGIYPDWVCSANGFFGLIVDPLTDVPPGYRACKVSGSIDPSRLSLVNPEYNPHPAEKYPGYEFQIPLRAQTTLLRYYAGPLQADILKRVDLAYTNPETGATPDYLSALSFHGWFTFISEPFAKFLFILMNFFHKITHSWGISIILLTVALRVMLYPLNTWSLKSTIKMQEIAPKVSAIQAKYKKEPKRAQMEIMTLYKEKGVNPMSSCLPLLIQLPFLIGMFDLLKSSFELRGASFIPGWIDNLTAPDVVFSWDYPILFFGNQFHLLPILLGFVMWAQQRFNTSGPKDKSLMTDQQKQQKMMGNVMTIVFAVMFYHFPSGLTIYWLSSTLLGILQQWIMSRKMVKN